MRTVHIERKTMAPEAAVAVLEAALIGKAGQRLTAAECSLATGLPLSDAEAALLTLTTRHPSRVGVTEDGRIEVTFERFERPADGRLQRMRRWLAAHRDQALAVFTVVVLPLLIAVGLIGTFSMMYGLELDHGLPDGLAGPLTVLGGLVSLLWLAVLFGVVAFAFLAYVTFGMLAVPFALWFGPLFDPLPGFELGTYLLVSTFGTAVGVGLGLQALKALRGTVRKVFAGESAQWAVKFWRELGGFFFGAPRPSVDALADERALVSLIRDHGGVVTTADLMGLFGWMPERADSEIVRVMMDYGGDVVVSESGAILWVFPDLGRDLGQGGPSTRAQPTSRFRGELPAPARFFACRRWTVSLGFLVMVPVFIGPIVHPYLLAWPTPAEMFTWRGPVGVEGVTADPGLQALGAWPGLLVFGGLLLRVPAHIARKTAERRRRRELAAIRLLCESPAESWVAADAIDTRLLARLDGELGESRPGPRGPELHVSFPKHAAAFAAAERVRTEGASALGAMTF